MWKVAKEIIPSENNAADNQADNPDNRLRVHPVPVDWLWLSCFSCSGADARSREGYPHPAACFTPNPHANRRARRR